MKSLIIAEHNQQQLKNATLHTITAAAQVTAAMDVLILGYQVEGASKEAASITGVAQVWVADNEVYLHQLAENCAQVIVEHIKAQAYTHVFIPATTFGKNLLPRVAALLDLPMVSDLTKIISPDTFERPIYAGNVIATVQSQANIQLLSVRTTAFAAAKPGTSNVTIQKLSTVIPNHLTKFEKESLTVSARPDLTMARVVIAGGRGLKSADNFHLLEAIADRLQGAVGASRAAVDAGFAPNDYQIGQTGKIIAPDLYIAVGISGAIQHLAGMKDSKVIVAINSDTDAPIFQVADYGLVGDLFVILPELKSKLDEVMA